MADFNNAAWERALERMQSEHRGQVEYLPGAIAWFCSCGKRSAVSGSYRTERQANASLNRHLRAATMRLHEEEKTRPEPPKESADR